MTITELEQALTTGRAAKRIGVKRARIWQVIAMEKTLAATLVADRYYIDPLDLDRLVRDNDAPRPVDRPRTGPAGSAALQHGAKR